MRMPSLASIAAALILTMGAALAAPALAQSDGAAADAGTAPAKPKRKKSKAKATASPDATAAAPDAGTAAVPADGAAAAAPAATPKSTKSSKKKKSKKDKAPAPAATDDLAPAPTGPTVVAPAPAPPPTVIINTPPPTTVTVHEAAPVAAPPAPQADATPGVYDDDPPTIAHTAIKSATRNHPLVFSAHISDPSGVFQPVLYLRKRGTGDYLPIKLIGSKTAQGEYAVEVDAKLISVDLEYYIEAYDNAGNGPARTGSPEYPLLILLEEEKKAPIVVNAPPVPEKHAGAPPAISHSTVSKAFKGLPIEINAKLVGDTGVSDAKVFFRHSGEHDFRALPMGNIGGDDYTATMPASVVTGDLEYYLEAYDQYGNGPGRTGGPNVPYQITVTEKPPEVIVHEAQPQPGQQPPPPAVDVRPQPHLVKVPFSPNPGRAIGWLFMGGFVAGTAFAGGEIYGAWSADQNYNQTFNFNGQLDQALHQQSLDYEKRAKIFGIAAVASLAVSITLLVIFPEHPDTQIVTGSGGDVALAHF